MFKRVNGWALEDADTRKLCSPNFYASKKECEKAWHIRRSYGHATIMVRVHRTWFGKVRKSAFY